MTRRDDTAGVVVWHTFFWGWMLINGMLLLCLILVHIPTGCIGLCLFNDAPLFAILILSLLCFPAVITAAAVGAWIGRGFPKEATKEAP
jgi:hypothetical protein